MPRGRMLNRKISVNKTLPKLSTEAVLLFTWTIPHLDVAGKIQGDPAIIKGNVVPYLKQFTLRKIEKCLTELQESGLIIIYGDEYKYIKFMGFDEEQGHDRSKEAQSEIPDPTPAELQRNSLLSRGKDKISKDKISKEKGTPPSLDEITSYCKELSLPPGDASYLWEHWQANGFTNGRHPIKDWRATIRSWKHAGYLPSQKQNKNQSPTSVDTPVQKKFTCEYCGKVMPESEQYGHFDTCEKTPKANPDLIKAAIGDLSKQFKV